MQRGNTVCRTFSFRRFYNIAINSWNRNNEIFRIMRKGVPYTATIYMNQ